MSDRQIHNKKNSKNMEKHKKKKEEQGEAEPQPEPERVQESESQNCQHKEEKQPRSDIEERKSGESEEKKSKEESKEKKEVEDKGQSNYKDLLSFSMRENARRIQKEFIEREYSANQYLLQIYALVKNFDKIRLQLASKGNYYLNYSFNYFGYRYESVIKNINFFHFAAQSWFIETFRSVAYDLFCECGKKRIKERKSSENHSFFEIYNQIVNQEVDEKQFIKTLELIAGTVYFNDSALRLTEIRIGRLFLGYITLICRRDSKESVPETLSKAEFETRIMNILIEAVERTLNKIENIGKEKNSNSDSGDSYIKYYQNLIDLKKKTKEVDVKKYIKHLLEDPSVRDGNRLYIYNEEIGFLKSSEAFYDFATLSISNLTEDIHHFNTHSTNIIHKLRVVLCVNSEKAQSALCNFTSNVFQLCNNAYSRVWERIDYNQIKGMYEYWGEKLNRLNETNLAVYTKKSLGKYSNWARNIYHSRIKFIPSNIIELTSRYRPALFVFEKVLFPTKDISLMIAFGSVALIAAGSVVLFENFKEVKKKIFSALQISYYFIKEDIVKSKEPLIEVRQDEERNLIIIHISRKLVNYDRKRIDSFIEELQKLINEYKEKGRAIYDKAREQSIVVKDTLMEKYRKFLNCISFKVEEGVERNGENQDS